jgi:hypothetical protein
MIAEISAVLAKSDVEGSAHLEHLLIIHALDSFGRHIVYSADLPRQLDAHTIDESLVAHLLIPLNIDRIIRDRLGYPKINNLQPALYQHKVRRLQIGMNDILQMYRMDSFQHLLVSSAQTQGSPVASTTRQSSY